MQKRDVSLRDEIAWMLGPYQYNLPGEADEDAICDSHAMWKTVYYATTVMCGSHVHLWLIVEATHPA